MQSASRTRTRYFGMSPRGEIADPKASSNHETQNLGKQVGESAQSQSRSVLLTNCIPPSLKMRGSLSLPTRPKLSRSSRSERRSNRSNLASKTVSVPRTFGSGPAGERKSAIATVPIAWARPTRPKLPCSPSARLGSRSNLESKTVSMPRTFGSAVAGERRSAMTSVAIGWATTTWGGPGTRPWAAIGGRAPMMTAPTEMATVEVITTRIGLAVE